MGPDDVYPQNEGIAEWSPTGGCGDAHAGRPDVGCRICSFQIALHAWWQNRAINRPVAASRVVPVERGSSQQSASRFMTMPVVGFVGMTHLGLVSATAVSSAGFATLCYDRDAALIARLSDGNL